ncbi:hypothetical protein [Mangrovimonas futianensis]|uniref:hypothetical protein n=1 Tax=Mangrovimonas futianensis TaxID=2895523 RepID=UPI001E2ABFE8|nr:hypothetical protein [Mangrovimonas futianensis]MCF1420886.1 hypothetical protein [Mangrovimonas futianensis]
MKSTQDLLTEISNLTREIEEHYPELYQYLDENPDTIPSIDHPKVGNKELQEYLNSLKAQLETYKVEH